MADVIKYEPEPCRNPDSEWSGHVVFKAEGYRDRMRTISGIARKCGLADVKGGALADQVELMLGVLDHVEGLVTEVALQFDGEPVASFAALDRHAEGDDILNDLAAAYQRGWSLEKN